MKSFFLKLFDHNQRHHGAKVVRSTFRSPDKWLFLATIVFSLFGIIMVYDSSVAIAIRDFSDKYYFVKEQFKWLLLGFVALTFFNFFDYHRWHKLALPILILTMVLLMAVFIPGLGVKALGAHRWLNLRVFILQPAELAKLTLIIYLAAWFSVAERSRLLAFLLLVGMIFGLVIIEPDLGTGIIILLIALILYFFSGASLKHFFFLLPILVAGTTLLAVMAPYRFARITSFLHPETDPLGASYQIRQVLIGLGSGGWFGVGIGKSRQKYEYLPEANTDSIFAIIGEEMGFVGGTAAIGAYLFIIWRGFRIAKRASDLFGKLLAAGITSWIGIQTTLNLAAMVALIPLTGVPLPLISYGGSSLVIVLAGIGILLNISRQRL